LIVSKRQAYHVPLAPHVGSVDQPAYRFISIAFSGVNHFGAQSPHRAFAVAKIVPKRQGSRENVKIRNKIFQASQNQESIVTSRQLFP